MPHPSHGSSTLDCLTCGACCFQRPGTILVTEGDIERWRAQDRHDIVEQLEPGHFGYMAFKMSVKGSCVFHGTADCDHACAIYADRAEVCRDFEDKHDSGSELRPDPEFRLHRKIEGRARAVTPCAGGTVTARLELGVPSA